MDTDSLYLALAEENLYDCIQPNKRAAWGKKRGKMTAETLSEQMQNLISSLERVALGIKNMIREPGLFKEEFKCTEMLCLCSKTYCCYDNKSDKFKFSS